MKGQTQSKVISVGLMILFVLFILSCSRLLWLIPSFNNSDICKFEHGEDWVYDNDKYFGDTCIEIDYATLETSDRIVFNMTLKEQKDKYCDIPSFFDFKKWDNGCRK